MFEKIKILDRKREGVKELALEGVFMCVGSTPNASFAKEVIKLDRNGYIITNVALGTSVPGIFAAGDVRHNLLEQIVAAMGEGAQATVSAEEYIGSLVQV